MKNEKKRGFNVRKIKEKINEKRKWDSTWKKKKNTNYKKKEKWLRKTGFNVRKLKIKKEKETRENES